MLEHFFKGSQTPRRLRRTYLGPFLDSFAAELVEGGYAVHSGWLQINVVEAFGRWLRKNAVSVSELRPEHAEKFLLFRRRKHLLRRGDSASLKRLMVLLCRQGVITGEASSPEKSSFELLVDEFVYYLSVQRGLAPSTILYYREFAVKFLRDRFRDAPLSLSLVSAADIIDFVRRQAIILRSKRAKQMTTALRSFLRFALNCNYIHTDLAASVPTVAHWSMASLPKALKREHVAEILRQCDRNTGTGRRDYAILLLLARLGLRAGEVASLTLDDIDWHKACIHIKGKGGRCAEMPIPTDVGEALVAYLRNDRPATISRAVFLRTKAPLIGLNGQQAVGKVVRRALVRAGIDSPRNGAHQLRHALACELLRQESTLAEIGELLRHRTPQTTMIYAKVDLLSLRPLAMPWPGGVR